LPTTEPARSSHIDCYVDPLEEVGEWWSVPYVDGRVVGRPRAGRRARQLLDGMYRSAVAMTRAGNNVVLEDVVWEPTVAEIALEALGPVGVFVVRLVCPYSVAVERERARADRFVGGVAAYADGPEVISAVDATLDTALHDRDSVAHQILTALAARAARRTSDTEDR
jgi:chloramphenicol 3-O-phosphotransferase